MDLKYFFNSNVNNKYHNPYVNIHIHILILHMRISVSEEIIHMQICVCRLVSFQKDLSLNPSNSNTTLRHSNTRSTLLKLIYIISSMYKPEIKCFEYFLPMHQVEKKQTAESGELVRFMSLDIQILDPAISLYDLNIYKNPDKPFFVRFQMFYTVKLTNSLFRPSVFFPT